MLTLHRWASLHTHINIRFHDYGFFFYFISFYNEFESHGDNLSGRIYRRERDIWFFFYEMNRPPMVTIRLVHTVQPCWILCNGKKKECSSCAKKHIVKCMIYEFFLGLSINKTVWVCEYICVISFIKILRRSHDVLSPSFLWNQHKDLINIHIFLFSLDFFFWQLKLTSYNFLNSYLPLNSTTGCDK